MIVFQKDDMLLYQDNITNYNVFLDIIQLLPTQKNKNKNIKLFPFIFLFNRSTLSEIYIL